jgi:hypothetical protein
MVVMKDSFEVGLRTLSISRHPRSRRRKSIGSGSARVDLR